MKVDLPAPLEPSRPVTPGGTDTLTSFRPITCPYHFETCSAETMEALTSPPPRRARVALCSSGGLHPAGPPATLARGVPRAPRSARVAHSPTRSEERRVGKECR